jgi:pre-mRNA-splicing factor CWC22
MSLPVLKEKLVDPEYRDFFEGLFPSDHPKNTRFAINFYTSIGQGILTEELRIVHDKQT